MIKSITDFAFGFLGVILWFVERDPRSKFIMEPPRRERHKRTYH